MNIWVLLVYAFVFGVAGLVLWVLRYWFVVLPRRDPRLAPPRARSGAVPGDLSRSRAAEPPHDLGRSPARAAKREPVSPR